MTTSVMDCLAVPEAMWSSELMARQGVAAVRGLIDPIVLQALRDDFWSQSVQATRSLYSGPNQAEWRGGEPARALSAVPPGPMQWHVFGSDWMRAAVSQICGMKLEATGGGTYSYYCEVGDFLALHRDIRSCEVAVITCLEEVGPAIARLRTYPESADRPLSLVDRAKAVDLVLAPGDTAILAGGIVPHEVTPLGEGQRRAVTITCFRLAV